MRILSSSLKETDIRYLTELQRRTKCLQRQRDLIHQVMNGDLKMSSILGIVLKDEIYPPNAGVRLSIQNQIYPPSAGVRLSIQNQRSPSILQVRAYVYLYSTRDHHLPSKCGRTFICTKPETTTYPASANVRLSVQNQRPPPTLQVWAYVYLYKTRDHHLSSKCERTFICTEPDTTTYPPSAGVHLSVQNQRPPPILQVRAYVYLYKTRDHHQSSNSGATEPEV
ncbi:hypothetical protein CDAR_82311 [Caerostris darwini]|uniref:Uncharacterized protein n=1 Tax=Caerostris darwini TaxID=1538125 RepID=A0AAV4QAE8_9ARAC|nr:hypothetical protein CDAR_82311 [Caerostris darwini]